MESDFPLDQCDQVAYVFEFGDLGGGDLILNTFSIVRMSRICGDYPNHPHRPLRAWELLSIESFVKYFLKYLGQALINLRFIHPTEFPFAGHDLF